MSWSESCSTDSGVRNPSTAVTFVATGAGGAAGWATGVGTGGGPAIASESGRAAAVSERPELLGIRSQAPAARTAHSNVSLRSGEHTSELQSPCNLVCRLLLEKKKNNKKIIGDRKKHRVI